MWNAFCEIHRKGWEDYGIEKGSEDVWKLGLHSYDETISEVDGVRTIVKRTHFMFVTTDPAGRQITTWRSIVETADRRLERSP